MNQIIEVQMQSGEKVDLGQEIIRKPNPSLNVNQSWILIRPRSFAQQRNFCLDLGLTVISQRYRRQLFAS